MIDAKLVICPNCKIAQDSDLQGYTGLRGSNDPRVSVLGTITNEGYFAVGRKFGRVTLIMSENYSVICSCGYYIRIESGKITSDSLHQLNLNG